MPQDTTQQAVAAELVEQPVAQHAIALQQTAAVALPSNSPAGMMLAARAQGASLAEVEKMMDLQERWERREAEKAFVGAMAEFKKNPPVILKQKEVYFENKGGGVTNYMHATHDAVTFAVIDGLSKHGFSHRWDTKQTDGKVIVTCVITHRQGHSESTTLESAPDQSGGKNAIQAVVSAKSYLERHTLLGATGLSTRDIPDDDGKSAGAGNPGPITEKIFDGLVADLAATKTDAAAAALWSSASKTLAATGRVEVYQEFKDLVVKHRRLLASKGAK